MDSQKKQVDAFGIVMLIMFFIGLAIIAYLNHDYETGPTGGWHEVGRQIVKELTFYGALLHITVFGGLTFIFRWRSRNASPFTIPFTRCATWLYGVGAVAVLVVGFPSLAA